MRNSHRFHDTDYELYHLDSIGAACDLIASLDTDKEVMIPLDGIWLDQIEAKNFCFNARDRDFVTEDYPGEIVCAVRDNPTR